MTIVPMIGVRLSLIIAVGLKSSEPCNCKWYCWSCSKGLKWTHEEFIKILNFFFFFHLLYLLILWATLETEVWKPQSVRRELMDERRTEKRNEAATASAVWSNTTSLRWYVCKTVTQHSAHTVFTILLFLNVRTSTQALILKVFVQMLRDKWSLVNDLVWGGMISVWLTSTNFHLNLFLETKWRIFDWKTLMAKSILNAKQGG